MTELESRIKQLEEYVEVNLALNATTDSAFWLKDTSFRFVRYNQGMLDMLYPMANFEDLLGKTDYEYAQEINAPAEVVADMKACCVLSDIYVLNANSRSEKFFERCNVLGSSEQRWLFTTKLRIPPESTRETCLGIYGTALEFKQAEQIIQSGILNLEKLSDNCYRLVD